MSRLDEAKQAYLDARVKGAKTMAEAYSQHAKDPEVFVAGVQYALDSLLKHTDMFNLPYPALGEEVVSRYMLHMEAVNILEKAKRGEPQ